MSQVFRWIAFLPAAVLSAALVTLCIMLLGFVLDLFPEIFDSDFLRFLPEGMPSRLAGSLFGGLTFVFVGGRVAPRWTLYAAAALVLIWALGTGMAFFYSLSSGRIYGTGLVEMLAQFLLTTVGGCLGWWGLYKAGYDEESGR